MKCQRCEEEFPLSDLDRYGFCESCGEFESVDAYWREVNWKIDASMGK